MEIILLNAVHLRCNITRFFQTFRCKTYVTICEIKLIFLRSRSHKTKMFFLLFFVINNSKNENICIRTDSLTSVTTFF